MSAPRPVVLSGPSGAGKSTILKMLMEKYPDCFAFSVSHTSRRPRPGEVDGVDYRFVELADMLKEIELGKFLESAEFAGNFYGTPREAVTSVINSGKICILDVEANGVRSIYNAQPPLNARFIFIGPPSMQELENRLRLRGTETEEKIQSRLRQAAIDVEFAESDEGKAIFDTYIINDDQRRAYEELYEILKSDIEATLKPTVPQRDAAF